MTTSPKRTRTRLARAELWLTLAQVVERLQSIAEQCERRAMASGYEEAWIFPEDNEAGVPSL